jgi:hypothetical protein
MKLLPANPRPGVKEDWAEALSCIEAEQAKMRERQKEAERALGSNPPPRTSTPPAPVVEDSRDWLQATLVRTESAGDVTFRRCTYASATGYRFSIESRSTCPATVRVNPQSQQVRW